MKKILVSTIAVSALLFNVSCDTDFETDVNNVVVSKGDADFTKFVSIGNSLTSGYRDGTLYLDGQNESFPSMSAAQMKLTGGGEFKQPLMPNNTGGFSNLLDAQGKFLFSGKLNLQVVNGALAPVASAPAAALDNVTASGPYQNMGVPGAKSFHLGVEGYGSLNPYFSRFAKTAMSSMIGDAVAQAPTFFSLWIGNNDVLSYATNGGMNSVTTSTGTTYTPAVNQTGNPVPTTYKSNDITDPTVVAGTISGYVNALTANGAKGVIANVPNVTSIPFFTRVRYNEIALDAAKAQALNTALYQKLNAALPTRFSLVSAGQNPVIIVDNTLADVSAGLTAAFTASGIPAPQAAFLGNAFGKARQANEGELILLTASNLLGKDALTNQAPTATSQFIYGASFPLPDQFSLTTTEVSNISTAVAAYNTAIKSIATAKGLAFVDANAKMIELSEASGIMYDGVKYTATFVTGGTFSLDGVHLTGRGYALIANEFMKQINAKYRSTLPMVNVNNYSGVKFP